MSVSGTRVLQVLANTDATVVNRDALDLHAALSAAGLQLRTVALAPGRVGGLAGAVPVVAPARRSIAALTQLRSESRWADVVVFRGIAATPPGLRFVRNSPPIVLEVAAAEATDRRVVSRSTRLHVVVRSPAHSAVQVGGQGTAVTVLDGRADAARDAPAWIAAITSVAEAVA